MPERLLVVTADDFGLTTATSEACVRSHRDGVVTAVSVLGNGAATESTAGLLREAPDLAAGAHLALVGEDPPRSAPSSIPTLVDGDGAFRLTWRELLRDLGRGRVDLADVRTELEAQLVWLEEVAGPMRHLNLHQHLQLWPSIGTVAAELARDHGIGFVRTPTSAAAGPRGIAIRRLAARLRRTCARAGVATTEAFAGLDEAGRWDAGTLGAALSCDGATLELNLHPGAAADPERDRFAWGYTWGAELDLLCDRETRDAVADAGWQLAGPDRVAPR